MGFQLEVANLTRDYYQGTLGNRPPLNNPKNQEANQLWNSLVAESRANDSVVKFGVIETGGADPQVQEVFLNNDYPENYRRIAQIAPDSGQRPLMRGENGHGLAPNSSLEIKALTKQNIRDSGGTARIKVFDSQADFAKLVSTTEGVKESHDEGYPAELEIAIPYGNGQAGQAERDPSYADFDPYPDEFYLAKVSEAIAAANASGLDDSHLVISFKAMVGDMDADTADRLMRAVVQQLKEEGSNARIGLHLHDTGLSKDAYVAAIKVAKEEDWPIIVDTAEGADTGFVNTLELDEALREQGIDLGLSDEQRTTLARIGAINEEIGADYSVKRISDALTGEDLRKYGIPGGGVAAFEAGVLQSGLAAKLNISEAEALHVAGMGLNASRQLMGWPFGVTPGFAQTQTASLHLIGKMVEAGHLSADMSFDELKTKTVEKLTDEQVQSFFLNDMPPALGKFIENNRMPIEHEGVEFAHGPHPLVRNAHPLDEVLKKPSDARYYKTVAEVEKLQSEGLLKPSTAQAAALLTRMQSAGFIASDDAHGEVLNRLQNGNVVYDKADGQKSDWYDDAAKTINAIKADGLISDVGSTSAEGQLFGLLEEHARHSGVCRQIVLGEGNSLRDRLEKPWVGEPLATEFQNNNPEYARAVGLYQQGLNAQLDRDGAEILRQHLWAGEVDINTAYSLASKMIEQEWHEIRASAITYMEENPRRVLSALESTAKDGKAAMNEAAAEIKALQDQIVAQEKAESGRQFFYSAEQRKTIAAGFFRQEVELLANSLEHDELERIVELAENPLVSGDVKAPMGAMVSRVMVESGQSVKKGDPIMIIEAMKMETTIQADRDGVIEAVNVQAGDTVNVETVLAAFESAAPAPNEIEQRISALRKANRAAADGVAEYLDQNAPKNVIGYSAAANENFRQPQPDNPYVELVINRAGCNAKIAGDLQDAGMDTIMLYVNSDKDTPVIRGAANGATRQVRSYTDHDEMLSTIRSVLAENEGKAVRIHPGWGFLSEAHSFVAKLEQEFKDGEVIFVGPSSEAMELAGDKHSLREEVEEVAPQYNPRFFENTGTIEELRSYVDGGFDENHPLHAEYKHAFDKDVMGDRMRGDVIIKAVAGGGGKGIEEFKYDAEQGRSDNYRRYVSTVLKNREYAHKHYNGNSAMLTERFVRGNAHHVEVQFAATKGNAMMLGYRDCTLQQGGQKIAEMNIIEGDYTPEMVAKIREAGELITQRLAEKGYEGVGTLEMLALPETEEVMVLEVNTRLQVEHGVTEGDIKLKTGKALSLPVLNTYLLTNDEGRTPQAIVEDVFGLDAGEQEQLLGLGTERYGQYRLTAKDHDLEGGEQVKPTGFKDTMWPASIAQSFRDKHGVEIIHGGIGAGLMDSQFGAILGDKEQFDEAIPELVKFFRLSALFDRSSGPISGLGNARELVRKILLKEDGSINPDISVNTVGEIIDLVGEGKSQPVKPANLVDEPHWPDERRVNLAPHL